MNNYRASILLIVSLIAGNGLPLQAQALDVPDHIESMLTQAEQAGFSVDRARAQELFDRARDLAQRSGNQESAAVSLRYARFIETMNRVEGTRFDLALAENAYRDVLRLGTPEQVLVGRNNLAVLLLRLKRASEAVSVLQQIDLKTMSSSKRALYEYNLGRANELAGNTELAFQIYLHVIEEAPDYQKAIDGAFRAVRSLRDDRVQQVLRLGDLLLDKRQVIPVGRYTKELLVDWAPTPDARPLLPLLVKYYVAASIDPQQFDVEEWRPLHDLALRYESLKGPIDDIGRAYLCGRKPPVGIAQEQECPFPLAYDRADAIRLVQSWTGDVLKAAIMSDLLKKIGDYYLNARDPKAALIRYATAWFLNPRNTKAALYTATVLNEYGSAFDPKQELANALASTYSVPSRGKQLLATVTKPIEALIPGEEPELKLTENGNKDILQMYLLLGVSRSEPRLNLLEQARAVEERRLVDTMPDVHVALAMQYERQSNFPKALEQYQKALQEFEDLGNTEEVSRIRGLIQALTMRQKAAVTRKNQTAAPQR